MMEIFKIIDYISIKACFISALKICKTTNHKILEHQYRSSYSLLNTTKNAHRIERSKTRVQITFKF